MFGSDCSVPPLYQQPNLLLSGLQVVTEEEDFGNNLYIILEGCLKFSVQVI